MDFKELSRKMDTKTLSKLISILESDDQIKWLSLQDLKKYNFPENIFNILKESWEEENQDKIFLVFNEETIQKIESEMESNHLIDTTMENIFNRFNLTSKETDFQKYPKELEINKNSEIVKTKDYLIDNSTKKSPGFIKACFISPLVWLNEEYKLNLSDDLEDTEIIGKIKKTKHFEISAREEQIYNAICYLIHRKIFNQKTIFISYNEIHKQLENNSKLRPEHKKEYESIIRRFNYLEILIDFTGAKYRDYKEFYKAEGNIKEPLIVVTSFAKARVKYGKTTKILDGFETLPTKLMNLHFNHPNQTNYFVTTETKEIESSSKKIEAKSKHIPKLKSYISKLYFLSQNKKNPYTDIKNETIFEELKEFNLHQEFEKAKKTKNGARFLNRNIYSPIESMDEVKNLTKLENGTNRIIWNIS